MKFFPKNLLIATVLATLAACGSGEQKNEQPVVQPEPRKSFVLDKLVGTWQLEDGKSFERWTKENDGKYRSLVYALRGTDTIINEKAVIYKEGDAWVFENWVNGQNNDKPVKFTSSLLNDHAIRFSNPEHDFPNQIHYGISDDNVLNAFITGHNEKGGIDTIPFNYKRVK